MMFLIGFISSLVINFPTINCQVLMHKSVRNYKLVENKNGIEGVMVMKADQRTREYLKMSCEFVRDHKSHLISSSFK